MDNVVANAKLAKGQVPPSPRPLPIIQRYSQNIPPVLPPSKKLRLGLVLLLGLLGLILYTLTLNRAVHEASNSQANVDMLFANTNTQDPDTELYVELRIKAIDIGQRRVLGSSFLSLGAKLDGGPYLARIQSSSVILSGNETGASMLPGEVSFPILVGSPARFPFDSYHAELTLDFMDANSLSRLPVSLRLSSEIPTLDVSIDRVPMILHTNPTNITQSGHQITLSLYRPGSLQVFSILLVMTACLIGAVSGVILAITFVSLNTPNPIMLVASPLIMLAMPTLRNSQPGVPPTGVLLDSAVFNW